MVKITVGKRGGRRSLVMEGHAGYCPGQDIVCAGCSTAACMLAGWVSGGPGRVRKVYALISEPGYARVDAVGGKRFQAVFDAAVACLMGIAEKYPENVQVVADS